MPAVVEDPVFLYLTFRLVVLSNLLRQPSSSSRQNGPGIANVCQVSFALLQQADEGAGSGVVLGLSGDLQEGLLALDDSLAQSFAFVRSVAGLLGHELVHLVSQVVRTQAT